MGMQYTAISDINYHVAAHISHYISALYPPSMAIVSLFFHPMNIAGYPTAFPWDQFFSWFIRYELLKNVGCISHGIPMEYLNIPPYIPIFVAWTTILHGQLYSYDIFFFHPPRVGCFGCCDSRTKTHALSLLAAEHEAFSERDLVMKCVSWGPLGMLIILSLDHSKFKWSLTFP